MKNKFTVENAAIVLIDHQQGTIKLARNLPREEIVQNTRVLARTAVESGMPLVLTSSMEDHSLTSTNQVMAELANSWSEGVGQTIQTIMYEEILSKFLEA